MKIITTPETKVPILCWCDNPEEEAIQQAIRVASLPFTYGKVCLMPDVHLGFGLPIGGVVALREVISPAMVGVDIGCGMTCVQTSLTALNMDIRKEIMRDIRSQIPLGYNKHSEPQASVHDIFEQELNPDNTPIVAKEAKNATLQLGTLGSGNHFLELQCGDDGHIYIMLHSGSRNLGKKVCDHYCDEAAELNKKWYSNVPAEWKLPFLPIDSRVGKMYWEEMNLALKFAFKNRIRMIEKTKAIFNEKTGCSFGEVINIHHNYATTYKDGLILHRKGATDASDGTIGLIPGSQGSSSYIVRGRGNPDSFESCSHGAGRKLGRIKACQTLDLESEKKILDDKGVLHSIRNKSDLEEATGAYKDINTVMAEQRDLVDILVKLEPLAVIKG